MDLDTLHLDDPDGFYEALLQHHEGLDEAQSALLNAKLVLLMANQIGDLPRLRVLLDAARQDITSESTSETPPT